MKTYQFPYVALGLGLFLTIIIFIGRQSDGNGEMILPLFTMLAGSEFGFFASAAGAYTGVKYGLADGFKPVYTIVTILCFVLAANFAYMGLNLWPN